MKITLTNDFHGTSTRLRLGPGGMLTARQIARARSKLCGIKDCKCGGDAGERGPQEGIEALYRYPDGRGMIVLAE